MNMKTHSSILIILAGACLLFILLNPVSAATFVFHGGDECLPVGSQENLTVLLSEVPDGLSGANVTFSINDPDIISIDAVIPPPWATLKTASVPSPGYSILKAVDLQQNVKPGDANVIICKLSLAAHKNGMIILKASPVTVEDDKGGRYTIPPLEKKICAGAGGNQTPSTNETDSPTLKLTASPQTTISETTAIPPVTITSLNTQVASITTNPSFTATETFPIGTITEEKTTKKILTSSSTTTAELVPTISTPAAASPGISLNIFLISLIVMYLVLKKREA